MFEFLIELMPGNIGESECPNARFPVSAKNIESAEERIGIHFPKQLRVFFSEIGCGFLKAPKSETSKTSFNYINRFLDPSEIADLILGTDDEIMPSEGFGDGELPFFEVGDRLYLVMRENQVCWPFGDVICKDLLTFATELADNPRFYHKALM